MKEKIKKIVSAQVSRDTLIETLGFLIEQEKRTAVEGFWEWVQYNEKAWGADFIVMVETYFKEQEGK